MRKLFELRKKRMMVMASLLLAFIGVLSFIIAPENTSIFAASIAAIPFWGAIIDGTFKEMTADEVGKLDPADQIKYFNDLNAFRAKQLKDLRKELETKSSEEIEKQIKSLENKINKSNLEQFAVLQNAIETQGIAIKQILIEGKPNKKEMSIVDLVKSKLDDIEKVAKNEMKKVTLKVTRSSVTDSTQAMRLSNIGQLATRALKLRSLFTETPIAPDSNGVVRYVDQDSVTRNAAAKAEGSAAPTSVITWIEKTLALQEIKDSIPVSRRALKDFNFVAGEISNFLMKNMDLKVDASLWNADGNAPNIKGIYTYATNYSIQTTNGITDASLYDLIVDVQTQVESSTGYIADYCLVNPANYNEMLAKKDASNNYIRPPFVMEVRGKLYVNGIEIIKSAAVTVNTMLLGDFTNAVIYRGDELTIEIGEVSTQFTEGMVTMLATEQLALLVRSAHEDSFVKVADITASLTALLP